MENKSPLAVAAYPVPWRVEVVDDDKYRGHEYVRSGPDAMLRSTEWFTDST